MEDAHLRYERFITSYEKFIRNTKDSRVATRCSFKYERDVNCYEIIIRNTKNALQ